MKKTKLWLGLSSVGILFTTSLISLTNVALDNEGLINDVLKLNVRKISSKRSDYAEEDGSLSDAGWKRMIQDSYKYCVEQEEQGAVLLKNENNCLPLDAKERNVTLFGRNSAHLCLRSGAGGAAPNEKLVVHLNDAFENNGFNYNKDVWNLYKGGAEPSETSIIELPESSYTHGIQASFTTFSDAAIVTFVRVGTENSDPKAGILDLQENEANLLRMIKKSGKFKKTIVLLNGAMPMSLDWASKEEFGVDAVLWFGVPGYYSLDGVVHILTGEANPSGHTPDTFSAHASNSAAYQNFGDIKFDGNAGVDRSSKYVSYNEGIYVGYKYYETRYEDCVLNQGNANGSAGTYDGETNWTYHREVAYPFGFGLSYTTFDQELKSITYKEETDTFVAKINIKNTGNVDGRASAQLYCQSPYTDYDKENLVEKSAIQLCGYNKVLVGAGKEVETEIEFDRYFLASYDRLNKKQYILEDGEYYFSLGNGAHEALNNIIATKKADATLLDHNGENYTADLDSVKKYNITGALDAYKYSHYDDSVEVKNKFDDADVNYWANDDQKITYLTRKDWQATFPKKLTGLKINDKMKEALDMRKYTKADDAESYTSGEGTKYAVQLKDESGNPYHLKFSDMAKLDYDDPKWDDFIKQMTLDELVVSMSDNRGILAVTSVSKPSNSIAEGPEGLLSAFAYGDGRWATGFATGPTYTATWDHEMQKKFGYFYGEEALHCGVACVNAPGANINRTPYGSRASEYMSEDGIMNYYVASNIVKEARKKGLIMNIKHCFLNNQETNRQGVATFCNEQAIREIYLKPFEGALTKGEGLGIMTSYNRIGLTYSACHKVLSQEVIRGEWDYKGLIIDDALQGEGSYTSTRDMIVGGTEIFCLDGNRGSQIKNAITSTDDGYLLKLCQKANKNIMYALSRSWMGDSADTGVELGEPFIWWKPVIFTIDGVFGALTLGAIAMFVAYEYVKKNREE